MGTPLTAGTAELADYARRSFTPGRPVLSAARDLTGRIYRDFAYRPGVTTVATSAAEAARLRRGVCQDFAHIAIACHRALGLAARYVSGYLDTSAQRPANAVPGGDASHAWFAVHAPGLGWVDFDPTNDRQARDGYVTLAWGRDYSDAAPLRGAAAGGGRHALKVSVEMAQDAAA
jgi:transglutaminase-like putative cysteine protease